LNIRHKRYNLAQTANSKLERRSTLAKWSG